MIPYFLNPFGVYDAGGGGDIVVPFGTLVMNHTNTNNFGLSLHLKSVEATGEWGVTADQNYRYTDSQSDIFIDAGYWSGQIEIIGKISKIQFGSYSRFDQLSIMIFNLFVVDLTEAFAGLGDGNGAGLTGTVYDLWNDSNYNTLPHTGCFRNCTGFTNYSDKPEDWK